MNPFKYHSTTVISVMTARAPSFFYHLTLKSFYPTELLNESYKLLLYSSSEYGLQKQQRHCHNCFEKPAGNTYDSSATKEFIPEDVFETSNFVIYSNKIYSLS